MAEIQINIGSFAYADMVQYRIARYLHQQDFHNRIHPKCAIDFARHKHVIDAIMEACYCNSPPTLVFVWNGDIYSIYRYRNMIIFCTQSTYQEICQ